jgi:hypothetical protein
MDDTLARVRSRVAERFPADLERIRDYLRMPSVSATGEGIAAVAEATGAWIEGAGGSFELHPTPGHPLVVGELPGPPGAPGARPTPRVAWPASSWPWRSCVSWTPCR